MLHEPATPSGRDPAGPYKARLGIWMFAFYTLFYAAFVAINLISPPTMATIVVAGLNLATVFGMGLIVLALVQALIYHVMCRRKEAEFARLEASSGQGADSADDPASGSGSGPVVPGGKA
jgi:uncharacterized membrane protein (DUF485 family)